MRAVDHFFPPSNSAVPSAPEKKSFHFYLFWDLVAHPPCVIRFDASEEVGLPFDRVGYWIAGFESFFRFVWAGAIYAFLCDLLRIALCEFDENSLLHTILTLLNPSLRP